MSGAAAPSRGVQLNAPTSRLPAANADLTVLPSYETASPAPGCHEIHVYFGNDCNRTCEFCVVDGRPGGSYGGLPSEAADVALAYAGAGGIIKLYGGEPTMFHADVNTFMRHLRRNGFAGQIVIFSNGVQAGRLIKLMQADPNAIAVLNYSIAAGRFAPICPSGARRQLLAFAARQPERMFLSHSGIRRYAPLDTAGPEAECARCAPALVTGAESFVHACPFAVEQQAPHYRLAEAAAPVELIQRNHAAFLDWVDEVLHPAARARGLHPCQVCAGHIGELPLPQYGSPAAAVSDGSVRHA
jgi:hypothetical protein